MGCLPPTAAHYLLPLPRLRLRLLPLPTIYILTCVPAVRRAYIPTNLLTDTLAYLLPSTTTAATTITTMTATATETDDRTDTTTTMTATTSSTMTRRSNGSVWVAHGTGGTRRSG